MIRIPSNAAAFTAAMTMALTTNLYAQAPPVGASAQTPAPPVQAQAPPAAGGAQAPAPPPADRGPVFDMGEIVVVGTSEGEPGLARGVLTKNQI